MLPKLNRLKKEKDFERVSKKGRALGAKFLVLKFIKTELSQTRAGLVVSKRVSNKAVLRNKAKRRLRAILKEFLPRLKRGFDVVIFSRASIAGADFQEIKQDVERVLKKAGLLEQRSDEKHI